MSSLTAVEQRMKKYFSFGITSKIKDAIEHYYTYHYILHFKILDGKWNQIYGSLWK